MTDSGGLPSAVVDQLCQSLFMAASTDEKSKAHRWDVTVQGQGPIRACAEVGTHASRSSQAISTRHVLNSHHILGKLRLRFDPCEELACLPLTFTSWLP